MAAVAAPSTALALQPDPLAPASDDTSADAADAASAATTAATGSTSSSSTSTTVKPWTLTSKGFINESGKVLTNARAKGVDVSQWQGEIDWEAAKADGVQFAILRCGWGDDDEEQDDATFATNVAECERLGIPYGVYLYSYAYSNTMAASEAAHVIRLMEGHDPSLGVYLDIEETIDGKPGVAYANRFLSNSRLLAQAKIFCNAVEEAGYQAGIYSNPTFFNNFLTSPTYDQWLRWLAQWCDSYTYNGRVEMWQCASDGTVDGIKGNVDVDLLMYTDLRLADVKLSKSSVYYNGLKQKPTVKVTAGGATLREGRDYTVELRNSKGETVTGCGAAGTYYVVVTGTGGDKAVGPTGTNSDAEALAAGGVPGSFGNCIGSKTVTFKVLKRSLASCSVELTHPSSAELVYNGKVRTPSVTVKYGGIKMIKGKHYTVEYSGGHKSVGGYTITVTGIGSLKGTVTRSFAIIPSTPTMVSAESLAVGKATVTWKKLGSTLGGYKIQRSTSPTFKSYTPLSFSGYRPSGSTFGGLKSGKTYYFRIQTYKKVNGVVYRSKWSNIVSVVVK